MIELALSGRRNIELGLVTVTLPTRSWGSVTSSRRGAFHVAMVLLMTRLKHRVIVRVEAGYVGVRLVTLAVKARVGTVPTPARVDRARTHSVIYYSTRRLASHLVRRDRKATIHGAHSLWGLHGLHGSHRHGCTSARDGVREGGPAHRLTTLTQVHMAELVCKPAGIIVLGRQRWDCVFLAIVILGDLSMYGRDGVVLVTHQRLAHRLIRELAYCQMEGDRDG